MGDSSDPAEFFAELSRLAAENPKQARAVFSSLLDDDSPLLEPILSSAAFPGEGRLRQLIANTVRLRPDIGRIESHLRRWSELETDEFAKRAIVGALGTINDTQAAETGLKDHPDLVQTYRYIADRLCHRVRNCLTEPVRHLRQLEAIAARGNPEMGVVIDRLRESFRTVARIVEFDIDDVFFEWRLIELATWIDSMTKEYSLSTNSPRLRLRIMGETPAMRAKIRANDYLLQTIFWNLWKNAQQAIGNECELTVELLLINGEIILAVADNGKGFTREDYEIAFADQFRRRGANYGRGLLEVQDAVSRLKGSIRLTEKAPGEFRITLSLPTVHA
jgi:signal transduction histidine kinase